MIKPNDPKWVGEKFNKLTVVEAVYNGLPPAAALGLVE